jgi:uncharacterized beta barrel domain-containing protein DUF5777
MMIRMTTVLGACLALVLAAAPVSAQTPTDPNAPPVTAQPPADPSAPAAAPAAQTAAATSDPDTRIDVLQPDFVIAALPTTLRMPKHKLAFMVTHRFNRPLGLGDFGDLLANFFGFDNGAQIGLELRYGLLPGTQIGVYRTSDRTIEIFGQQSVWQEKPDGRPLSIDIIATLEGQNNMQDKKSSAVGLLFSKKLAKYAAVYAEPIYIFNTNPLEPESQSDNNTMILGLGGRLRLRPSLYVVGEVTPRLTGYEPGVNLVSFGVEARAGGHQFQINFGNGFGTTLGQLALGASNYDNWYIGFNISRKFF